MPALQMIDEVVHALKMRLCWQLSMESWLTAVRSEPNIISHSVLPRQHEAGEADALEGDALAGREGVLEEDEGVG